MWLSLVIVFIHGGWFVVTHSEDNKNPTKFKTETECQTQLREDMNMTARVVDEADRISGVCLKEDDWKQAVDELKKVQHKNEKARKDAKTV